MASERLTVTVRGRVQGVGFRAFVQREATTRSLTGWTRNLGYNEVQAVAEGERVSLEAFLDALRRGPSVSRVDECLFDWQPATGEFQSFEIRSSR